MWEDFKLIPNEAGYLLMTLVIGKEVVNPIINHLK